MEEITEEVLASGIILPQSVPQIQNESLPHKREKFLEDCAYFIEQHWNFTGKINPLS
jgi:hypothetical protein